MTKIKITKISTLIFLLVLFSFCKNNTELKIRKEISDSYMRRNQIFSNRLKDKYFMFYKITGCEFKNELKSVMIYRENDCSTCVKNCYETLESSASYKNIAIIKIGVINKKDSLSFVNIEEIFCDESGAILNTYDYFPTPVVFEIENQRIKKSLFCY